MIAQGFELGVFMGTNDDSVVVRDADGKPVGEMRLVAVPISPEEQRAMLGAAMRMLMCCNELSDPEALGAARGSWGSTWRDKVEFPALAALERSLAGIGGHFPALWCGEVPMLGVWRASWVWDDWRAAVIEVEGEPKTIADLCVPRVVVPAPSIGAQLGELGGPWPVLDCRLEPSLNLTAWDREVSVGCRGFNPVSPEWCVPESDQIPREWREADCMFRVWLSECGECPLNGGGS